jgi:FtsZ-binding cell division protein ZapB
MNRITPLILGTLILTTAPLAEAEKTDLAVTRVALFSSGVGYFECDATVKGDAQAELKFRTEQINDIIKSMVVQDFSGGKVGLISYASRDPIEKTLRSFAVDLTGKPTLGDLLVQLRGEPVEITAPRALKGTIVGVDKSQILSPDGKTLQTIERLDLLTDKGLEGIDLTQLQGLKLLSEKIDGELRKALATLATGHDADKKTVVLDFEGQGERQVRAAYLLEAPIWKTSYRLVLSDEKDKKPFVQGWATVENATEEDWNNVRLSLISGRPISFRMDLYTPLYVPRPLETLQLYASLRPPEYEGGFAAAEKGEYTPPEVKRAAKAMRLPTAGGRGAVAAGVPPPAAPEAAMEMPPAIDLAGTGVESLATAQQAGELFAYHIDTPVSIPRQHSAMLPIVNQEVEAAKISIFNPATHPKYPLNGLELKNTTGKNLMQGPVTVFDANTYAGDAKLPDLKPDEKRLVAYALDLSTEVLIKQKSQPDELVSLKIAKGTLWHRHKFVDSREYEVKNKADKDRTLILEQAYSEDWKLIEPKEPYERTQNLLRFKVQVPASKTIAQNVVLERVADQSVILSSVGLDDIRIFLKAKVISPKVKEALEKIIALRTELDELTRQRTRLEKQHEEAVAEQARIRENLKTLDKSTDAYQKQLKAFDEVDGRITQCRQQIGTARDQEEQKRKALESYLLSLDVE